MQPEPISYETAVDVLPWARVVVERNPGPMTLDGTNTWLLGRERVVVVDPGEDDQTHLTAVLAAVAAGGGEVAAAVVTHGHHDHSGGAHRFHELSGAPVHAVDPAHCAGGGEPLVPGATFMAGAVRLDVVATPGHTADSVCLLADDAVLTGDTVLGRGTTVVAWPDGDLGDYLASLRLLAGLGDRAVLPGHGPALPSCAAAARAYLAHREQRLAQVRAVVEGAGGLATGNELDALVERVVDTVYVEIDPAVRPAARLSVRAQLEYLRA